MNRETKTGGFMSFITIPSDGNFESMGKTITPPYEFWMKEKRVSLDEAKKIMSKTDIHGIPVPFEITACTFDIARKTGGEKVTYSNAVLCPGAGDKKRYNHANGVRNIKLLDSNEIRSINPLLIIMINGQKVYL